MPNKTFACDVLLYRIDSESDSITEKAVYEQAIHCMDVFDAMKIISRYSKNGYACRIVY